MNIQSVLSNLNKGVYKEAFSRLYGSSEKVQEYQMKRYIKAVESFSEIFPTRNDINLYSAPGRTEIGGNHTDHQQGSVLAGAVNLDAIAIVSFHNDGCIRLKSEGFEQITIDLSDTGVHQGELGTSAIVRGIAARFKEKGIEIGGFDAYCTSDVICGGGISSSAAFEMLICTVIDEHYNKEKSSALEMARIGWFAETTYFGKKCGLLDQTVSAFGGLVGIDFSDVANPIIEKIDYDFSQSGYTLCITDTKSSHEDLTDDYVAIREEMEAIAAFFGKKVLSQVDEAKFYESISELRQKTTDRAVMRAAHFFDETRRAKEEAESLKNGDFDTFLKLVNESGDSSSALLQNLYSTKHPTRQDLPLAIMVSKRILGGKGAVRVHGGGFAGTIQAFVPNELVETYSKEMEKIFGIDTCLKLTIRPVGGVEIKN